MIRLDTHSNLRSAHTWGCTTLPCNHVYVLNGKIDECQHSSVAISRASRVDSTGVPIRKGDVCSNRLGKLTKSRQLSACSWVTDFECSHVTYACIVCAFIACIHAENSPLSLTSLPRRPAAARCLFDVRSKGHISLTPFSATRNRPIESVLFYPDATSFLFCAFPFP